ncbi:7TM diverse intracellular signaling domain-containing protein [Microscilla marina]|uniref:Serine/threonine protein kinases n=1 Tax=Microscilla marina ATCC 23134 TaxID=313606 RepID=A1ZY64_MICM2|nr:7TM diverse intracellular signaling domain-containing protein [Microscilla marina]EAY24630.1 serine/threonine protein kinases [Microscilla marina ATCC 23134]
MFDYVMKVCLVLWGISYLPYQAKAQTTQRLTQELRQVFLTNQTLHFFEDKEDILSRDQVSKRRFKPVTHKGNNFGLSPATYWFRFKLKKQDLKQTDWLLELAHPLLDTVDIHYQKNGQWTSIRLGDKLPFAQRPVKSRHFVLPIQLIDTTTHTFYIRIHTTSTLQLPLTVYQPVAFLEYQNTEQLAFGLYYGVLLVMALYNLFIYFSLRVGSYLLYAVFIALGTLFSSAINGHAFQYLWGNMPIVGNYSLNFVGALFHLFFLLYAISFLEIKKYLPRWRNVLHGLIGGAVILAIISLVSIPLSIKFLAILGVVNMPLVILLSVKCYRKGLIAARFFILAWVVFIVGVVLFNLQLSGVLPTNVFTRRLGEMGGIFAVVLLSLALADRYRLIKQEKEDAQDEMLEMQKDVNDKLEQKVQERTQQLQAKSDEVMTQNEELHQQKEEIVAQNEFIAETNLKLKRQSKQTHESIRAAKVIQQAILPRDERLEELFVADYFVLYQPKDIVSGDFYWVSKVNTALQLDNLSLPGKEIQLTTKRLTPSRNETVFLAVVDCTGHGVPGAFMSMIGNSLLNEIVNEARVLSPAKILTRLHEKVQQELKQNQDSRLNHGMDVCLCKLEQMPEKNVKVTFTGAKRPLYYIKGGKFGELKGDRMSIGGWSKKARESFTEQTLELQSGDVLYLTTDGYADNPNPQRKSFGTSRLKKLLADQVGIIVKQQHKSLIEALVGYQEDADQRDDITIVGVKV